MFDITNPFSVLTKKMTNTTACVIPPIHEVYDVYERVSRHLSEFDLLNYQLTTRTLVHERYLEKFEEVKPAATLIPPNLKGSAYENMVFGYIAAGYYSKIARRVLADGIIADPVSLRKTHELGILVQKHRKQVGDSLFHDGYVHAQLLNSQIGRQLHLEIRLGTDFKPEFHTIEQAYHVLSAIQLLMRSIMVIDIEPTSHHDREYAVKPTPWASRTIATLIHLVAMFDLPEQAWKPIVDEYVDLEVYRTKRDLSGENQLINPCLYACEGYYCELDEGVMDYNIVAYAAIVQYLFNKVRARLPVSDSFLKSIRLPPGVNVLVNVPISSSRYLPVRSLPRLLLPEM